METTNIYTLTDPDTNEIRYVGKANNPKKRFYKHYVYNEHNTHKNNWINKLIREGKKPILDVIDVVRINEWVFWETYWINQIKAWGFKLTNSTIGGEGSTFGNQTSFKKGQIPPNKGVSLSDEAKERLRQLNLGKSASQETKDKMSSSQKKIKRTGEGLITSGEKTRFNKGEEPWNKDKFGYKLGGERKSRPVQQFDLDGKYINEFIGYTEASQITQISDEGIRKCCNGKAFNAGGFKWKWK